MNVLSLFNGMSFTMMALESLDIPVTNYYSSEIDKYANQATQALFPSTIQLGDITRWKEWDIDWSIIDLVVGGPPCQAFSVAGKQLAFDDERGLLTKVYFDILRKCKPKTILMENVSGMLSVSGGDVFKYVLKEFNNCGYAVDFIEVNSALVSAQNRRRIYLVGKLIDDCQGMEYTVGITKGFINERKNRDDVQGGVVV